MNNLTLNDEEEMCTEIKQAFGDSKILFVASYNLYQLQVDATEPESGKDSKKAIEVEKLTLA